MTADNPKVVMAITEEYGYRHWLAVLSPEEFDAVAARWRTIKNLSCLVPVRFLIPQAQLSSSEEIAAAKEQTSVYGDKLVFAHVHESDDSFVGGVDYKIPETGGRFEIDGTSYEDWQVQKMYDDARPEVAKELNSRVKFSAMPVKTVEELVLLKNSLMAIERQAFETRTKLDTVADELIKWLEENKHIKFETI